MKLLHVYRTHQDQIVIFIFWISFIRLIATVEESVVQLDYCPDLTVRVFWKDPILTAVEFSKTGTLDIYPKTNEAISTQWPRIYNFYGNAFLTVFKKFDGIWTDDDV